MVWRDVVWRGVAWCSVIWRGDFIDVVGVVGVISKVNRKSVKASSYYEVTKPQSYRH